LFGAGRIGCGYSPPDQAVARQKAQNFRQSFAVAARDRRGSLLLITLAPQAGTERRTCSVELKRRF